MRGFAAGLGNAGLRRAQASFALAYMAEWGFTVVLSVIAYRDGGAAAVGLVALARWVPSALLAPAIGAWTDRVRREWILIASSTVRAVSTGIAAAIVAADGPPVAVYALAVVATIAYTPFRAAHTALLPSLCTRAEELTACNVVRGMLNSLSILLGPLVAALLLDLTSAEAAYAAVAGAAALSALVLLGLRYEVPPRAPKPPTRLHVELADGLRAVRADGDVRLLFAMDAVQTFTRGCLTVLTVTMAIDLLGLGERGVGFLTAAMGAGAVAGSFGAALLVGRSLPRGFGLGVAFWGGPLILVGLVPETWAAILALAVIGAANAVRDVGLFTLIARLAPDALLGRVGAVLEAQVALMIGLGSILAPLLLDLTSDRPALVVIGALGPLAAVAGRRGLHRLDARMQVRDADVEILRGAALLAPLPLPTVEELARRAERIPVATGGEVIRQGETGHTYYVIEAGEAEAFDGRRLLRVMHPGDGFGEIALLRDTPRTATVRARTDLTLMAVTRADFMIAVAGFSGAAAVADTVVEERLARSAEPV